MTGVGAANVDSLGPVVRAGGEPHGGRENRARRLEIRLEPCVHAARLSRDRRNAEIEA